MFFSILSCASLNHPALIVRFWTTYFMSVSFGASGGDTLPGPILRLRSSRAYEPESMSPRIELPRRDLVLGASRPCEDAVVGDAWIGLIGVVIGFLVSYVNERSRRGYERGRRFEEQRRAAYVKFIEATGEAEKAIRARNLDLHLRRERPDMEVEVRPRPDSSKMELAEAEIVLLSRFSTRAAALMYRMSLETLDDASGPKPDDPEERKWRAASSDVIQRKDQFLDAAKKDLDLPLGLMTRRQVIVWRVRKRLGLAGPKPVVKRRSPVEGDPAPPVTPEVEGPTVDIRDERA
jgi:hypothetical protein